MNHVFIAGHLGSDPEVRFTSTGQKVTLLRVACNNRRGNKDETVWWKVTIWGEQFDKMISYLKKGSPIMVFGELSKPEIYTDKEGRPQVSLNLTATSLQFSPFGRSQDNKTQATESSAHHNYANEMLNNMASRPDAPPAKPKMSESFNSNEFQPSEMMRGQNSSTPFDDDDIPF